MLLDAFTTVRATRPDAQLVIVGAPVLGQEAYGASLRERVRTEDSVVLLEPRGDIPEVVADLDVLALASIEPESYGLVLVEALASGTPVVATDLGGPPEIVGRARAGTGLLVPPGEPAALAAALLELLPASTSGAGRRARLPALTLPPPRFAAVLRDVAARRGA